MNGTGNMERSRRWNVCVMGLAAWWGLCPAIGSADVDHFGAGDGHHGAKSVSGIEVVNAYSRLGVDVTTGDGTIEVADGTKFQDGDLVLVWQVNGLPTPASGEQSEIDLTGSPVGRYELARVTSVATNTLNLDGPMLNDFVAGNSQVVFVPEYTDVTVEVGGEIEAADWDPATGEGGIVAFFARGAVRVDGRVTANGKGFLGGQDLGNSGNNGCTGLDEPSPRGAEKGEGVAGLDFLSGNPPGGTGRGNRANGAGGGVCHNSGGGGGGHGALGGLGGRTWRDDADPSLPGAGRDVGGMGGAPLGYTALTHLLMGGGGGAGQQNNGIGGGGSDGGGVVWVRAGTVSGTGTFEANGVDGSDSVAPYNDAAGGAGAGGLVVVRASGSLSCGSVQATGGAGGSAQFDDHGTGGGGAGGHTLLQGATVSCAADVSGGLPGVQTDLTDPPGETYGAQSGGDGDQETPGGALLVDSDGDGLLDVFEGADDADADGSPHFVDADDDGDGIPTSSERADDNGDGDPADAANQDADLVPDYLDADSDDDGLTDTREANGTDADGDGVPDGCVDVAPLDGLCDGVSLSGTLNTDATFVGGDALPDHLDGDADADGIGDTDEAFDLDDDAVSDVAPAGNDHDFDGVDDAFDIDCLAVGTPAGCLVAGTVITDGTVADDDGDGTPNWLQTCGDGYVTSVPSAEACDDGDLDDDDGCTAACLFGIGFGPCATTMDCEVLPGAVCDDSSLVCLLSNGNGPCTELDEVSTCQSGVCDGGLGTCEACADDDDCGASERCQDNVCVTRTCGDGVVDPGEACDDGDLDDDDTCANTCLWNAGAGSCVSSDDCVGSVLVCDDPDGVCRYPLGTGSCTEDSELDVCAGGICDETLGTCEACAENGDCGAEERCSSNVCVPVTCGDGVLDPGEACDAGPDNGVPPAACAVDCRFNVGSDCVADDECTGDVTCDDEGTCDAPDPRTIDSDGDGIPDAIDPDDYSLSGGRGVGCRVGATRSAEPVLVLLLILAWCLGIRRYSRR